MRIKNHNDRDFLVPIDKSTISSFPNSIWECLLFPRSQILFRNVFFDALHHISCTTLHSVDEGMIAASVTKIFERATGNNKGLPLQLKKLSNDTTPVPIRAIVKKSLFI
jgi:hypothetical protein